MRLIQTRVPADTRESVLETLNEENIEYIVADEGGDSDAMILYFPLPDGAVENVLDRLYGAGLAEDAFTVITDIESATTPTFDELESQYSQGPDDEVGLSRATLRTNAREQDPDKAIFVTFAALSAIVASAGLLLDSAVVIVGAMVLSPFADSSLSASVGMVIGDYDSIIDSFKEQLLGILVSIASATAATAFFQWVGLVPSTLAIQSLAQVSAFSIPIVLSFVIAIFAGVAGALALATDISAAVTGVAVAAAIVPAAAAVGLGIVWSQPEVVFGAIVLLLMNIFLINVSAFVALTAFGYRAPASTSVLDHVHFDLSTVAYAVLAALALVALAGAVISTYQYLVLVQTVNQNVDEVLAEPQYDSLRLVSTRIDYGPPALFSGAAETISVTVSHPEGSGSYPELSATLHRRIARNVPRDVTVRVTFTEYQETSRASGANRSSRGVAPPTRHRTSPRGSTRTPSPAPFPIAAPHS